MFQFGSVVLSYNPNWWIQLGIQKYWVIFYTILVFYIEKWDFFGPSQYKLGPLPDNHHTYTYAIWWDWDWIPHQWAWAILEGSTWICSGHMITMPNQPVDLWAMVETTQPYININGSHFTQISYYDPSAPLNWRLWSHFPYLYDTGYYDVERITNYEFKGWLDI